MELCSSSSSSFNGWEKIAEADLLIDRSPVAVRGLVQTSSALRTERVFNEASSLSQLRYSVSRLEGLWMCKITKLVNSNVG